MIIACLNAGLISFITVCICSVVAVTSISAFRSIFPTLMEVSGQSKSLKFAATYVLHSF